MTAQPDALISLIKVRAPVRFQDGVEIQRVHGAEIERSTEKLAKLILLQHTPVFTLGRSTQPAHLPCSEHDLSVRTGADVVHADRGGSITFHGPGQLTAYMLLNLHVWQLDVHQHLALLEQAAIDTLARFGIQGRREEGMTGVWVGGTSSEKICAIGISARRWVTYHGLSLNVDLDLGPFAQIIPCGLAGKAVTSMSGVLRREINISDVEFAMGAAFSQTYQARIETGMV